MLPCCRADVDAWGAQAKALLARNYSNAQTNLESIKRELAMIRDSVTILEARAASSPQGGLHV